MKRIVLFIISVLAFALLWAGVALGFTVTNLPVSHRQAALNVSTCNAGISAAIHAIYPGIYVRYIYGGYAGPGYVDLNSNLYGLAFTSEVAEEWCHELQLACDAPGGYGSLTTAWHAFMATVWPQVDTSQWTGFTWNHTLMDALRQAWWYPFYSSGPVYRVYATRAQMTTILQSIGVTP